MSPSNSALSCQENVYVRIANVTANYIVTTVVSSLYYVDCDLMLSEHFSMSNLSAK